MLKPISRITKINRPLTNIDLLYAFVFQNKNVVEYINGDTYPPGQLVYIESNNKTVVYKVLDDGSLIEYTFPTIYNMYLEMKGQFKTIYKVTDDAYYL